MPKGKSKDYSNRGQSLYAAREKYYAQRWRETGLSKHLSYNDYKKSKEFQQHKQDYIAESTGAPQLSKRSKNSHDDGAGPSSRPDVVDDRDERSGGHPEERIPDESASVPDDFNFSGSDWDLLLQNLGGAGMADNEMDIDDNILGQNRSANGGAGSRAAASTKATGSHALVPFGRTLSTGYGHLSFVKNRVMYSYAYANTKLPHNVDGIWKSTTDFFTTPLALIPVDYLPFYLTPVEYTNLPPNTFIKNLYCKVKVLGVRSGFDTGTTNSGVATAEYVPILQTAIGLNNQCDIHNYGYDAATTAPMVPTSLVEPKQKHLEEKWYGSAATTSQCTPRSLSLYATQLWNKNAVEPPNTSVSADSFKPFTHGTFHLDKVVNQWLLNSAIGEEVINYKYKPSYAPIKMNKESFVPYINTNTNLMSTSRLRDVEYSYSKTDNRYVLNKEKYKTASSYFGASYQQKIEKYSAINKEHGLLSGTTNQPQVHIGMAAIPQLNPSTESKNFLNACVYYQIECGIDIGMGGINSRFTSGTDIIIPSEQQVFWDNDVHHGYTQPDTVLGRHDPSAPAFTNITPRLGDITSKYPSFSRLLEERNAEFNV